MKAGAEDVFSTEAEIRRPAVPRRTKANPLLPPGAAKQAGRRGIRYGGCGQVDTETDHCQLIISYYIEQQPLTIVKSEYNMTI